MRISAKRADQFRYAFNAGMADGMSGLSIRLKHASHWWTEAYLSGYDYGMAKRWPNYRKVTMRLMRWTRHRGV